MPKKQKKDCGKILKNIFKWTNTLIGTAVVVFALYQYSNLKIDIKKPWEIFIPFYSIIFGLILVLAELKIQFLLKRIAFLQNFIGRGIYCIYLSTIVVSTSTTIKQEGSTTNKTDTNTYVAYLVSLLLLLTGVLYIFMYFCVDEEDEKEDDEEDKKKKPLLDDDKDSLQDKESNKKSIQEKEVIVVKKDQKNSDQDEEKIDKKQSKIKF